MSLNLSEECGFVERLCVLRDFVWVPIRCSMICVREVKEREEELGAYNRCAKLRMVLNFVKESYNYKIKF